MAATADYVLATLTSGVQVAATAPAKGTASTSTLPKQKTNLNPILSETWQYGAGAGQVNLVVCQQRTLNGAASETLNLFDGSLVGVFGEATGFAKIFLVHVFLIANPDASTAGSGLTIGNAASNTHLLWFGAATHTQTIGSGGAPFQHGDGTGKTVDNTHKSLLMTNADATNKTTYTITVLGQSN